MLRTFGSARADPGKGRGTKMMPVWIVDDDRSIRWVFEKALEREGIACSAFSSAQDALDALHEQAPEVLVSDIRMPRNNFV